MSMCSAWQRTDSQRELWSGYYRAEEREAKKELQRWNRGVKLQAREVPENLWWELEMLCVQVSEDIVESCKPIKIKNK